MKAFLTFVSLFAIGSFLFVAIGSAEITFREATIAEQARYSETNRSPTRGWQKTLPPVSSLLSDYKRTIIHIHSVYSHDACDNKPFLNGVPNEGQLLSD